MLHLKRGKCGETNMNKLILQPNEMSQWYALVNEAQVATRVILNENTESYLVFLLMRFLHGPKLIESVVALDFLSAMHTNPHRQIELLIDVGDKSLLCCGLFPGLAKKRHVSLEYFVGIGQSAYLTVGELYENKTGDLYLQLGEQFLSLQKILCAMRNENNTTPLDNLILAKFNIPYH